MRCFSRLRRPGEIGFLSGRKVRYCSALAPSGNATERSADVAQLVERNLAKVEVAGSNPVVRSEKVRQATVLRGGRASLVEWPRGEATDCKSVYTGSNPVSTSRTIGAAVARFPDTEEVTGSIPVSSTNNRRWVRKRPPPVRVSAAALGSYCQQEYCGT